MKKIGFAFLFLIIAIPLMILGIKTFVQPEDNVDVKDAKKVLAAYDKSEKELQKDPTNSKKQFSFIKNGLNITTIYIPIKESYKKNKSEDQRKRYLELPFPESQKLADEIKNTWKKYPNKSAVEVDTLVRLLALFDKSKTLSLSDFPVNSFDAQAALDITNIFSAKNKNLSTILAYIKAYNATLLNNRVAREQGIDQLKKNVAATKNKAQKAAADKNLREYLQKLKDLN